MRASRRRSVCGAATNSLQPQRRGALNREEREGVAEATVYVNFPLEGERVSRRSEPASYAHVSSWKYRCYGSNRQSSVWNIFRVWTCHCAVTGKLTSATRLTLQQILSLSLSLSLASLFLSTNWISISPRTTSLLNLNYYRIQYIFVDWIFGRNGSVV